MGSAYRFDDGETKTGPDFAASGRDPKEAVEDERQAVGRDPDAAVLDRQHRGIAGLLDVDAWRAAKDQCVARRFAPDEDPEEGHLVRHGQGWAFDYEGETAGDDEPVYRLGEHSFGLGDYVTVTDHGGRRLTYKVTEVSPA